MSAAFSDAHHRGGPTPSKYDTARDAGPTVADLAEALVAQKGALTSAPAPVTIDGHAGLYLKYRVSKRVDVAGCEDRAFDIFTTGPGGWYLEASREQAASGSSTWTATASCWHGSQFPE